MNDIISYTKSENIGKLSTIIGRYYCMDRDKRWDRIELAYNCLVNGEGCYSEDPIKTIKDFYNEGITDEFVKPIIIGNERNNYRFRNGDAVLAYNFRADRMREISIALNYDNFSPFKRNLRLNLYYNTMTEYQADFPFPVLFKKAQPKNIFGEVISNFNLNQLRIAETEKYAHVTYFFNGGDEKKFIGEDRYLVPSPKVKTYDLQPEMSSLKVTEKTIEAIKNNLYDVIILNFANGDMVGHTGVYNAAIQALEALDNQIGEIVELFTKKGGKVIITSDHGNCEEMWDFKNNLPHTQHTVNPVPFILVLPNNDSVKLRHSGKLCDVAPTMLDLLNIKKPREMSGKSLIEK